MVGLPYSRTLHLAASGQCLPWIKDRRGRAYAVASFDQWPGPGDRGLGDVRVPGLILIGLTRNTFILPFVAVVAYAYGDVGRQLRFKVHYQ